MGLIGSISAIVGLISALIYLYVSSISEPVLITTSFGQLKGFRATARSGRLYNAFRAIPYAKPPVGERRFKAPEPFGSWSGVRDATVSIPTCLQANMIFKMVGGQEDCLVLNVYTPAQLLLGGGSSGSDVAGNLLPVMVYFHGGHWMSGSSDVYGPQYFMEEDVVLVTVNYRVGALGFLNTGDGVVSGNMGLKDQTLALKWVQAAIKDFGGDKNLVTIFGESAGGISVDLHTLSPLSKNLFHRAISQSGTSLCPWALSSNTATAAQTLAKKFDCPAHSSEEMVHCLRSVDGLKLVESHQEVFSPFQSAEAVFGPSVENVKDKSGAFLTELPSKILGEGRQGSKVPMLMGLNSEEGCYRSAAIVDNERSTQLQANWTTLAPKLFIYDQVKHVGAAAKILKHYFGVEKLTSSSPPLFGRPNYAKLTQAISDRYFFICGKDSALAHASSSSPTFFYWFSYKSSSFGFGNAIAAAHGGSEHVPALANAIFAYLKKGVYDLVGWETFHYGACHADDIFYLFDPNPIFTIRPSSPGYELSRSMVKTWVNFAKHGAPGTFGGVSWEKVNSKDGTLSMMKLDSSRPGPVIIKESFASASKFWDSLNLS